MKNFWNKIKPLDYKSNPIGSLKVEIMFHLAYLSLLSYISGSTLILHKINDNYTEIYFEVVFLLMLLSWIRLALVINKFKPI